MVVVTSGCSTKEKKYRQLGHSLTKNNYLYTQHGNPGLFSIPLRMRSSLRSLHLSFIFSSATSFVKASICLP
jgi:hypothetical protein